MAGETVTERMRINRKDAAWLGIAVLLHASLLLIPFDRLPSATEISTVLSVSLRTPRANPEVVTVPPLREQRQLVEPPPLTPLETLPDVPLPDPARTEPADPDELPRSSTALLIDSASRIDWPSRKNPASRQLGEFVPRAAPPNWRPGISVEDNLFNGMIKPVRTEIVDRWLAADGSHNVVVNTTSGDTLCGRAQPWDPMNPLVEPIMAWWKCAGGGERTFKMPERFMRSRRESRAESSGYYR